MKFQHLSSILFAIPLVACNYVSQAPGAAPALIPSPSPAVVTTKASLPTPTTAKIAIPTATKISNDWALEEPADQPLVKWQDLPVMPEAMAGKDNGDVYIYTIETNPLDVYNYYVEEMPKLGWNLFAVGESGDEGLNIIHAKDADLEEFHAILFYMQESGGSGSVMMLVHPDTRIVYVLLTRD